MNKICFRDVAAAQKRSNEIKFLLYVGENLIASKGLPEMAAGALKEYLSTCPDSILQEGIQLVIKYKLDSNRAPVVSLNGCLFQLTKNNVEGKKPWVLFIARQKTNAELFEEFRQVNCPELTKAMADEIFKGETFEAPIAIAVHNDTTGIKEAYVEGEGVFFLQHSEEETFDADEPIAYRRGNTVYLSIPTAEKLGYLVFKPSAT